MSETTDRAADRLAATDAPTDRPTETLDARELPPPQPLKRTLERLTELGDETVLVQLNDRAPQHLYPKLQDRGYRYDTSERSDLPPDGSGDDAPVVTAVWKP
jgi:TusA-related sulfurtransferase